MKTPEFSEFSYGHALVDTIMHGGLNVKSSAPIFPNLRAEGSVGGGYDVEIPAYPVPLFLQFKIPQIMKNRSLLIPDGFSTPYFRMHLRTAPNNQHNMLVDLEKNGNKVFYATPMFDTCDQLSKFYTKRQVADQSAFFSPCDIGVMDEKAHHVAYDHNHDYGWARSEPRKLEQSHKIAFVRQQLVAACNQAYEQAPQSFISSVLGKLVAAINNNGKYEVEPDYDNSGFGDEKSRPPNFNKLTSFGHKRFSLIEPGEKTLERIVHLCRTYLDCEFLMLSYKSNSKE